MVLVPIFMTLFASWMLWGWCVGESRNLQWLRRWCAPPFVITVALISAGAGAVTTRVITRQTARQDVSALLTAIESRLHAGQPQVVLDQLKQLDRTEDPFADEFDVLQYITDMTDVLNGNPPQVAEVPADLPFH